MANELMSIKEIERFELLKSRVKKGVVYFFDCGEALCEIRDSKLYRGSHGSFEEFCQDEYEMSRRDAARLMTWVAVESDVNPCQSTTDVGGIRPNHTQTTKIPSAEIAQVIAKSPKSERKEVWKEAVDTAPKDKAGKPKVTAAHVKKVVAKRKATEPEAKPEIVGGDPWAKFNDAVTRCLEQIALANSELRKVLDAVKGPNKCRHEYAYFISYLSSVGAIEAAVKHVADHLPAEAAVESPGYIAGYNVRKRAEFAAGRNR